MCANRRTNNNKNHNNYNNNNNNNNTKNNNSRYLMKQLSKFHFFVKISFAVYLSDIWNLHSFRQESYPMVLSVEDPLSHIRLSQKMVKRFLETLINLASKKLTSLGKSTPLEKYWLSSLLAK